MNQIIHIRNLAKQREKLFDQWGQFLFTGHNTEADKLNNQMDAISNKIASIIGRHPTGLCYGYYAKMKKGDFTYTQLQTEIQNRKETISS